jgi:hypothetical protein
MKTHKRVIAVFVAFAFLALLQVSAMPLRADQAPDQAGAAIANPEQGPNYIEEEGTSSPSGKKSIMPVILIGLGVAAVAAVLILVVFKTKYDIVGQWNISGTIQTKTFVITFAGDKKSGTLTLQGYIDVGTYTVSGKTVHFEFHATGYNYNWVYEGEFSGKDAMGGTVQFYQNNAVQNSGTWTGARASGAASTGKVALGERPCLEVK